MNSCRTAAVLRRKSQNNSFPEEDTPLKPTSCCIKDPGQGKNLKPVLWICFSSGNACRGEKRHKFRDGSPPDSTSPHVGLCSPEDGGVLRVEPRQKIC